MNEVPTIIRHHKARCDKNPSRHKRIKAETSQSV
jgi:hypothetical protein